MSIVQLSAIGVVKYTGNYGLSGPYTASGITANYFDIAVDDTNNIIWQYQLNDTWEEYNSPETILSLITSSGTGNVSGPSSATDNAIVRFDATTGKLIQNSIVTISDAGNITLSGTVDGRDISVDGTKLDTIETSADITDFANVSAAISNAAITTVTVVSGDYVLIQDISDSNKLRRVTAGSLSGTSSVGNTSFWWPVRVTSDVEDCVVSGSVRFHLPVNMTINSWGLGCSTTPAGSSLNVTLKHYDNMLPGWETLANGSIAAGEYIQTEASVNSALTTVSTYGIWMEIIVTSVGSSTPGKGLVAYLKLTPT